MEKRVTGAQDSLNPMTDLDWQQALISRTIGAGRGRAARGSPRAH